MNPDLSYHAAMLDDKLRRVQEGYATPETIARARNSYARCMTVNPWTPTLQPEQRRDKWESHAVGMVGGAHGALLGVWLGAPLWAMALIYLAYGISLVVWANRNYRRRSNEEPAA